MVCTLSNSLTVFCFSFVLDINTKVPMENDFVEVVVVQDRNVYKEYHAYTKTNQEIMKRAKANANKTNMPLSIALVMVDTQSASNMERKMPKILKYLKNDPSSFIFKGHTINGDGTTAQLCAILTGINEEDLPEARRGMKSGQPIDRWPFIFKDLAENGYVSMFSEDDATYGAFTYRLWGFRNPPTDHYARPFWFASESSVHKYLCLGNAPIHKHNLDYTVSFYEAYRHTPKISLTVVSALCHNNLNQVQYADQDLVDFYRELKERGDLDKTIVILFGDHGPRASDFRATMTGKLEERLPFLSVTVPKELLSKHKGIRHALESNNNVLTSHFDIYATIKHLLTFPKAPTNTTGQSLFTKINPQTRTCKSVGIKDHWCPCLKFEVLKKSEPILITIAQTVITFMNNLTQSVQETKTKCSLLSLESIKRAGRRLPSETVQYFKETGANAKCDSCVLHFDRNNTLNMDSVVYEIVFVVKPSGGVFETTVTVRDKDITVDPDISRLNLYGNQPKCIQDKYPHLRKYCYCLEL